MKKALILLFFAIIIVSLTGCSCDHEWNAATCTTKKTCVKCGAEQGEPLGHLWMDATATAPKTCERCGMAVGNPVIEIPDLVGTDEATGKAVCTNMGLIPRIEYGYSNDVAIGNIMFTTPEAGTLCNPNDSITITVCKGYHHYELDNVVGYMLDINNVDSFSWEDETKYFYDCFAEDGYLYISMCLCCTSDYPIEFYGDFGTASINDTFNKTVPIDLIYDSKTVDRFGGETHFTVKIPLEDLGVQKPTDIYTKFDFTVNSSRETFEAGFNITW